MARAITDRLAGAAVPALIALMMGIRLWRSVDTHVPLTSTTSTGHAAISACQGLAAVVGATTIVSATEVAKMGNATIADASASVGTNARTSAPWAALKVRCHGSRPVAPTSSAMTTVAAIAAAIRIVSVLASNRARIPANASRIRSAFMPAQRRTAARPAAPVRALHHQAPGHHAR